MFGQSPGFPALIHFFYLALAATNPANGVSSRNPTTSLTAPTDPPELAMAHIEIRSYARSANDPDNTCWPNDSQSPAPADIKQVLDNLEARGAQLCVEAAKLPVGKCADMGRVGTAKIFACPGGIPRDFDCWEVWKKARQLVDDCLGQGMSPGTRRYEQLYVGVDNPDRHL